MLVDTIQLVNKPEGIVSGRGGVVRLKVTNALSTIAPDAVYFPPQLWTRLFSLGSVQENWKLGRGAFVVEFAGSLIRFVLKTRADLCSEIPDVFFGPFDLGSQACRDMRPSRATGAFVRSVTRWLRLRDTNSRPGIVRT